MEHYTHLAAKRAGIMSADRPTVKKCKSSARVEMNGEARTLLFRG
jgi:hypothetical protein